MASTCHLVVAYGPGLAISSRTADRASRSSCDQQGPVGLDRYGVVHPRPTLDEYRPVYPAVPYEVGDLAVVVHEESEDLGAVRLGELGLT